MKVNYPNQTKNYESRYYDHVGFDSIEIESYEELDLIMQAAQDYVNNNPECLLMKSVREPLDMYRFKEQNEALDKTKETYPKITVEEIVNTCVSCPSQWEGKTTSGETIYVRYRWGYLEVRVNEKCIYEESIGDNFDGYMTFDELKRQTSEIINWRI